MLRRSRRVAPFCASAWHVECSQCEDPAESHSAGIVSVPVLERRRLKKKKDAVIVCERPHPRAASREYGIRRTTFAELLPTFNVKSHRMSASACHRLLKAMKRTQRAASHHGALGVFCLAYLLGVLVGVTGREVAGSEDNGWTDNGSGGNSNAAVPDGATSLVLVLDVSGSMHRHLQQVADGLQGILNATLSQGEVLFHNYVLVPFHDPVVGPTLVTREPAHFEQRLRALTLRGGGDCPEMALTALREALRLSLRGSHVYLFTDARAKDYHLLDAVLALVQRKEAQVVFVLTGDCGDPSHPGLVAFQRIAAASSGHVFRLRESDVKEVISFVKASMQPNKVSLVSVDAHSEDTQLLELNVDSTLRELMVSVSGDHPNLVLSDPQGKELVPGGDMDVALDVENALAVVVRAPAAGRWQLRVSSADSSHTVRATGVSEAGFRHGFSRQPTDSMRHTHRTPLSGNPMYVLVNGTGSTVLKELHLVNVRGDQLANLSLKPVSRRMSLYNASGTFIPPDDFFYLKVVGTDKAGYPVNRLTPTAIKAEPPDVPEVATRQKVLAVAGGNVTLRCSLHSLLPAVVHWLKDGSPLDGPQHFRGSFDFPLHVSRISSENEGTYFCTASNDIGAASSLVLLEIKASSMAPQLQLYPAEVHFRTGDTVRLACDVKGHPKAVVKWNVAPALRDRVHINGSTLTLHNATAGDELQELSCMASNAAGSDEKAATLHYVDPPKITVREGPVVTVVRGSNRALSCVASGTPRPQARWSKGGLPVAKGLQPDGSLLIAGAGEADAGDYTCDAVSPGGTDSYTVRVYVLLPPQMEESVSHEIYKVIENAPFSLQCRSSGSPIPLLEWHKDGRKVDTIADNLRIDFSPERDVLHVAAATFLHDGVYKCVASNAAGITERSFRVIVLLPPQIQGPDREVLRVVEGEEVTLSCRVVGTPAPTASFLRDGVSWPSDDRGEGRRELFFAAASAERDAGTYVCRATNEAGSAHKVFELVVLVPPSIEDQETLGVVRVRGGSQAVLRCAASGVPIPEVSWLLGASRITGADGRVRPGTSELVIETAREQDAGRYRCNAVNEVGTASREFVVDVLAPPALKVGQRVSWELLEGEPATLDCSATGNPAPAVTWSKAGTEITPVALLPEGIDLIRGGHAIRMLHVTTAHAGPYSCEVVNEVGRVTRNFSLSVLVRPAIWTGPSEHGEEKVNVVKGDNLVLFCNVTGQPKPVVRWLRDGLPLEFRTGISLLQSGRSLNLSSLQLSDGGKYVCIGTNNLGSASRAFEVEVQEPPSIDTSSQDRHQTAWLHQSVTLACPASGSPAPQLSWFHDGVPLLESDPKLLFFQGGRLLTLRPALPSSAGIYTCEAVNAVGRASLDYILEVLVPPSIPTRNLETRLKVVEGAMATLRCPAQGKPAPTIVWMRGPEVVTANDADPRIDVPSGDPQSLIIQRVQLGDRKFTCIAGNAAGTAEIDFILDVMVHPKLESGEEKGPGSELVLAVLNRPTWLRCPALGVPPPSVRWLRAGRLLSPRGDPFVQPSADGRRLQLRRARLRDAGNYTCIATNEAGKLEKNFTVEVQVPPQISSLPASGGEESAHDASESVHVVANETLTLQCRVTAQPIATVVWMKESTPLKADGLHRQVSPDSETLTIDNVEVSDRGKYTCVATNDAGTDEKDFHVSVLVPPTIAGPSSVDVDTVENRRVSLECSVESLPRATVYWTKNSLPYLVENADSELTTKYGPRVLSFPAIQSSDRGTYSCIAENEAGLAEKAFRVEVHVPPRIQVPEATVSVVEHSPIKLRCIASGEPPPSVVWMRDDIPLDKRDSKDVAFAENGQILQIPNATLAHSGRYSCVARNAAGMAEEQLMLTVLAPPHIAKLPSPAPVVLGRPARLECRVERGNPPSKVEWTKDGELLDERQPLLQIADGGEVVHVVRATEDTEGAYACRATNAAGSDEHTLFLSVLVPPRLVTDKKQRVWRLSHGSDVQMECFVFGRPTPRIIWYKDNQEVMEKPGRVSLLQDGQTLYVTRVSRHEAGRYACAAENVAGNVTAVFEVHVHSPPEIEGDSAETESSSTQVGASLELSCVATGDPEPVVAWVREGVASQQLFSTALSSGVPTATDPLVRVHGHGPRATLEFKRVRASDAGNYTCVATSSAGVAQKRFLVDVSVPASITKPSEKGRELSVALGESAKLECRVTGSPEPSLRWMKDGAPLFANDLQDSRFTFLSGGQTLLVQVSTASDAGVYECEASNPEGSDELQYVLSVIEPPDFGAKTGTTDVLMARQGDDVVVRCPFLTKDGQLRSAVSTNWRLDGRSLAPDRLPANLALATADELRVSHVQPEDAGYYTCTATNAAGEASFTTFLDVLVPPYFEEPDAEEVFVMESGSVTLECFPRGIPEPVVSWSLYENKLPEEGSFFKLPNASAEDAGHYVCQASNDAGVAEKDFILVVLVRPGFNLTELRTDISVLEGEEVQLPCPATGVPEPRRIWYREGRRRVYPGPSMQLSSDGTLTITPARVHDAGSFTCVALSEAGTAEMNVTLTVYVPPSIRPTTDPGPVVVVKGHPARLACEASGVPAPTVSWFKTDAHGLARLRVGTGPFLDFTGGVSSEHEGCYVCLAENEAGSQERSVVLMVIAPPTVERTDPVGVTVQAVVGHNASLRCSASGSPRPNITWLRNGAPVPAVPAEGVLRTPSLEADRTPRVFASGEGAGSTLNIVAVEADDAGPYLCAATNKGGTAVVEYHVDVVVPPHLVNGTSEAARDVPVHTVVLAQHPFSLACDADGVPLPTFTWNHDGLPLPRESLTSVRGKWLHVSAAQPHHAGHYLCEASNVGGAVWIAYNVTVWEAPQISGSQTPVHLSMVLGETATLECPAVGTPAPVLSWTKDGHPLEVFNASESLTLDATREEDAGIYACTAVNDAGVATREISLTILVPPRIRIRGDSSDGLVEVVAGKPALLECIADGFPRPRVSWSGPPFVNSVASSSHQHGTLRIARVGKEHAGNYSCTATNEAGSDTLSVALTVLSAPSLVKSTDAIVVVAGQPAILWCNNTGDPEPQVTWHKGDQKLEDDDQAFEILPGALYIYRANVTDSGRYVCTVQNHAGSSQAVRNLDVLDPPVITVFYPEQKVVVIGDEISLICQAKGHPKPAIYWEHNDVVISDRNTSLDQRYIFVAGGELKIPVAESRDAGLYRCRAENQAGWDSRTATVTVHVPPHIDDGADEVSVQRGGTAVLHCEAQGHPTPLVTWSREGEPVDSPRAHHESNGDLVIAAAEPEDSGSYLCSAENAAGVKLRLVSFEVLVPPSISTLPRDQQLSAETYAAGTEDGVSELVLKNVVPHDHSSSENGAGQHKATANVVVRGERAVAAKSRLVTGLSAMLDDHSDLRPWFHALR
ncbi:hemicentin-1-like isoform X4 [Dermacentor albipictus]|uniref:hemicentin-1-like isoform X4 n=1 Tax=Dermacentor albipictus TaxID=60249 RepID=UPI0031FC5473